MTFNKTRCKNCGNIKTIPENDRDLYEKGEIEFCFICGGEIELLEEKNYGDNYPILDRDKIYEIRKDTILLSEIVHVDLIEGMKRNISIIGNDRIWEIIEGFKDGKMRLSYRKLFLQAGGEFPITEIK